MLTTAQNAVLNDETCTTTSHEKFPIYPLQNYTATNFFSQQCVYRYSDWLCSAFVKCPVQLEAVTSPSPPRQPSGIWQWSVPREWGIWHKRHSGSAGFETCPGEVGNLNRNCQVSPAEYSQVSIFVIEEIQIWFALTPAQRTQYWRQLHHHDLWQF